jgi:hypothetical protein
MEVDLEKIKIDVKIGDRVKAKLTRLGSFD